MGTSRRHCSGHTDACARGIRSTLESYGLVPACLYKVSGRPREILAAQSRVAAWKEPYHGGAFEMGLP